MKKIFLIEKEKEVVDLLKEHLHSCHYQVTTCQRGMDALHILSHQHFDLIIMDLSLPDMSGLDICKKIRELKKSTPIMMLSAKTDEADKVLALELGADDFVTKPFSIREVVARSRALLRRSGAIYKEEDLKEADISIRDLHISKYYRQVHIKGKRLTLTVKEFDLLYLLAAHPGKTFSRKELLELVWGMSYNGYEHTVTSHINRLRMKIEMSPDKPEYIFTTWGMGYRMEE